MGLVGLLDGHCFALDSSIAYCDQRFKFRSRFYWGTSEARFEQSIDLSYPTQLEEKAS